jgi:hypothetical protein
LKAVDAWRLGESVPPSRAAAIRHLAEIGIATVKGRKRKE